MFFGLAAVLTVSLLHYVSLCGLNLNPRGSFTEHVTPGQSIGRLPPAFIMYSGFGFSQLCTLL